ncbi:MAG: hypothetical protein Q9222_002325 [Ikaeria aurantiellina]
MFQATPSPTPNNNPTSATSPTTSSSSPRSSRRRGLSYLKSYTHNRLSSLAGSSNDSSPATPPFQTESFPPLPSNTTSEEHEHTQPTLPTDHGDEALLPPNPLSTPLSSVQPDQPIPGDGAATSVVNTAIGGITRIMARHRTESRPEGIQRSVSETATSTMATTAAPAPTPTPAPATNGHSHELPSIRLVPHNDPRSNRPSLTFPPLARTLPSTDSLIRVGRYSERDAVPNPPPNVPSAAPVGFKSKVVSRKHCEFWCKDGQWYIRDVKSSSGTFLNHIRLSQPGIESRPFPVNDGDVVQLGIDFRGGEEMIFRCVKIRVECNRGWQKSLNNFKYSRWPLQPTVTNRSAVLLPINDCWGDRLQRKTRIHHPVIHQNVLSALCLSQYVDSSLNTWHAIPLD